MLTHLCANVYEAVMSDRCGNSPMKTIWLCDKTTLIPLCETCKAGPPTAPLCGERAVCFICVYSTYSECVCVDIVHLYICVIVNLCKYVPPTKLCVCVGST